MLSLPPSHPPSLPPSLLPSRSEQPGSSHNHQGCSLVPSLTPLPPSLPPSLQIARVRADHAKKEEELNERRKKEWETLLGLKRRFEPMRASTASFEAHVNKVGREGGWREGGREGGTDS